MAVITVGTENSGPINLYYEDYGSGAPVVLIHGYPLSGRAWDKQVPPLLAAGRRVITYDRRGFGKSSQPASGYDWDTFAADLSTLIDALGLEHVTLVGHSMGTGEVTRYLGTYGSAKVDRAVLIGPIPPYLSQAPDNPDGVPANLFDGFRQSAAADGPAWLKGFLDLFYNIDQFRGNRVSDEAYNASFNVAVGMSAIAVVECITTWQADFRADLPKIDVPVLVVQATPTGCSGDTPGCAAARPARGRPARLGAVAVPRAWNQPVHRHLLRFQARGRGDRRDHGRRAAGIQHRGRHRESRAIPDRLQRPHVPDLGELGGRPLADLLIVRQRERLLPAAGQHQHQAGLQRFVQRLTGRPLPEQREYPLRLGAGQGGVSRLGDSGDVLLVHRREALAVPAVEVQALTARPPSQAERFSQEIERVGGLVGGVSRARVPH